MLTLFQYLIEVLHKTIETIEMFHLQSSFLKFQSLRLKIEWYE